MVPPASHQRVIDLTENNVNDETSKKKLIDLTAEEGDSKSNNHNNDDDVQVIKVVSSPKRLLSSVSSSSTTLMSPSKDPKRRSFSCAICLQDDVPASEGFTLDCGNKSNAKHRFCKTCLVQMIRTQLGVDVTASHSTALTTTTSTTTTTATTNVRGNNTNIVCPDPKCTHVFSWTEIHFLLRQHPVDLARYTEQANWHWMETQVVLSNSNMNGNTNATATTVTANQEEEVMRRCPAMHCNYIFTYLPPKLSLEHNADLYQGRHFDCPMCQASFCLQCGANDGQVGPAHNYPNQTCAQRRRQLQQQAAERKRLEEWRVENNRAEDRFRNLLEQEGKAGKTLPCPHCQAPITKNGGCRHMTCGVCGKDFSWTGK